MYSGLQEIISILAVNLNELLPKENGQTLVEETSQMSTMGAMMNKGKP